MSVAAHSGAGWDAHVHVFDAAAPHAAGHYAPATRTLAEIEAVAAAHGVRHLVLVQPSVYGSDNTLLLQALAQDPGRHRGVVVLTGQPSASTLDAMHAAGVRGARLNLVSPAGETGEPAAAARALAPLLRERGWHMQWYAHAAQLPLLVALQRELGVPFALDHLAGLGVSEATADAANAADTAAWDAAAALAQGGAWIKLSGWYRLGGSRPYAELHAAIARAEALFGERCVWGSDWPHTGQSDAQCPSYDETFAPLRAALGDRRAAACRHSAARLYGA
jgi:predicted TIM-barrel fold metal-dependent hydrolase